MMQTGSITGQFGRRMIVLTLFASLLTITVLYTRGSSKAFEPTQQGRRRQSQRRRHAGTTASTGNKYSRFKHIDHRQPKARLECSSCHIIPSAAPLENIPPAAPPLEDKDPASHAEDVAAATKPGAKGYPYHDSCVRCHRAQFFRGVAPPICTVCHTHATPRLTARDMHPFPKLSAKSIEAEFPGYFPHDRHQAVIARNQQPPEKWSFARAILAHSPPQADEPDNCATCHITDKRAMVEIPVGGNEKPFKPEAGTFKSVPTGHAACFNCHWQSQKPTKDECEGCHLTPDVVAKRKRATVVQAPLPGLTSPNGAQWFKDWPREWPKRLSIKFNHESKNHNTFGCTTCHINITQMETLNIPKADVPMTTCAQCHLKDAVEVKTSLSREMTARKKDSKFVCTACHAAVIGRESPKCSHYLVLGQLCKP